MLLLGKEESPIYWLLCVVLIGAILFYTVGWYGKKK
jgi:hypothetical protein